MKRTTFAMLLLTLLILPVFAAAQEIPNEEEAKEEIMDTIMGVYGFIKWIASGIGLVALAVLGIMAILEQDPMEKRKRLLSAGGVIVAIAFVWLAPSIIGASGFGN